MTYSSNALEENSLTKTERKIAIEDVITIVGNPSPAFRGGLPRRNNQGANRRRT